MGAMVDGHGDVVDKLESRVDEVNRTATLTGKQEKDTNVKPETSNESITASLNAWSANTLPAVKAHLDQAKSIRIRLVIATTTRPGPQVVAQRVVGRVLPGPGVVARRARRPGLSAPGCFSRQIHGDRPAFELAVRRPPRGRTFRGAAARSPGNAIRLPDRRRTRSVPRRHPPRLTVRAIGSIINTAAPLFAASKQRGFDGLT
jgi:hypothetical protein